MEWWRWSVPRGGWCTGSTKTSKIGILGICFIFLSGRDYLMNKGRKRGLLHDSPCTPLGQSRCLSSFLSIFHILFFDIVIRIHVSVIHLETMDRKATLR